ncbi:hypothetical protein WJX84_002765 [Apatococcus fuscideae]|uniref:Uncharacterized protein n=1 Tax=Apatococcus fuscideae TaxID=2026836 RepID=A0AAW1TAI2_9CHLO
MPFNLGVSSSDRPPLSGFKWPNRKRPVAFVNISSPELAAGARGVSKSKPGRSENIDHDDPAADGSQ